MATKKPDAPRVLASAGALKHNPFAELATLKSLVREAADRTPPSPARPLQSPKPAAYKVQLRLETKGRSGKVVTRISGLPEENLEAIAGRLRKALGCSAIVEESDVLLTGSLADRASDWLDRAGDLRAIVAEPKPLPKSEAAAAIPAPLLASASAAGTRRSELRRGQRVAIVMKADQATGKLTEGIVRDLLTNSTEHPRGIKVRLESGEVGRVKIVLDPIR